MSENKTFAYPHVYGNIDVIYTYVDDIVRIQHISRKNKPFQPDDGLQIKILDCIYDKEESCTVKNVEKSVKPT